MTPYGCDTDATPNRKCCLVHSRMQQLGVSEITNKQQEGKKKNGADITKVVFQFFRSTMLHDATFLYLTPNYENLQRFKNHCPISLCNVIYKIISKILANKLKDILDHLKQ